MSFSLMSTYLSLMDSQSIASCCFSAWKSLALTSKSLTLSSVHNKFPSSLVFIFFFFCFLWHNYSTAQGFWNKGSNMSSILWYSKLIPNISIFYFHFFLKKFYWYRINAQSKFFFLKSHYHDFYISLTLQTSQNVFTLVNTLASVLRFNSNPIFFEQSVKVT